MSKYESLWIFLKENNKDSYQLHFDEIEKILGFAIDHSFLTYKKELLNYGYEVTRISMKEKIVYITKLNK